jgi:hypothetical protein
MTKVLVHKWIGGTKVQTFATRGAAESFIKMRELRNGPPAEIIETSKANMLDTLRASGWADADMASVGSLLG